MWCICKHNLLASDIISRFFKSYNIGCVDENMHKSACVPPINFHRLDAKIFSVLSLRCSRRAFFQLNWTPCTKWWLSAAGLFHCRRAGAGGCPKASPKSTQQSLSLRFPTSSRRLWGRQVRLPCVWLWRSAHRTRCCWTWSWPRPPQSGSGSGLRRGTKSRCAFALQWVSRFSRWPRRGPWLSCWARRKW